MEPNNLEQIGLNEKESRIYLKLLQLGSSTVSTLAKETKINRSLLYFKLLDLEEKGIVSYIIKNNVRNYKAIEPQKILSILKEKEKSFKSILPKLIELQKGKTKKPEIEILEGREGIKTILNEILRLKKEWYAFNVPGKGPEILGDFVYLYEKKREKAKIPLKVLSVKTEQAVKRAEELAKMKYTKVKYLGESYESPASNYMYGDRVAIIFWYKDFPFAIRIIDKNLADSYKKYFNFLWNLAKR